MEVVAPCGGWCGPTINTIISPVYKHVLYCFTAGTSVREHRIKTEDLIRKRAGVQEVFEANGHSLDAVLREQTRLWLESTGRAISNEEANRLRYNQRYRLCGCCSPNCSGNYKISKRAVEELEEVKSLLGSVPGDDNITREPGPRRVASLIVDPAPLPPSRWVILRRALLFIVSDDPNEGILGLWGPDKDDNTNILKHINDSFLEQSLFDFVIFVSSPSDCSVTNIQSVIVSRLGMRQDGNEATRATRIREQLENKNFLLIVDDLRQNLDLGAVGIPYPLGFVGEKKRKVVIMSLSGYKSVGDLMGVNKNIELPILQEGEARELFRQSVSYTGDLYSDANIGPHAISLVRAINGLPSELVRYGKSMRGTTDASFWKVAIDDAASKFSRSRSIEDTLRLIEDDPTLGIIGIWGPGGVGKTHLLKIIQGFFRERMTTVLWVTASKECSVLKVQTQILEELKLKGDDNMRNQSGMIRGFLENKSFLLLLDDLWDRIDLEAVGLPLLLGIEPLNKFKRKVVLTTRFTSVCGGMEVKKQIQVPYLSEIEAWELFREKVGDQTLFSPDIEDRARILVTEMKGLPFALVTVGRAMYGKFSPDQWDSAIQHMKKSCCIDTNEDPLKMEEEVFRKIMFSYDNLKSERLKNCFLTCALWPEDRAIQMKELAKCWIGLGLVNVGDTQSPYTNAYSLMGDLTGACLLEGCGELNDRVKLHDVIRDMSIWISCGCGENNGNWFVRAGVVSEENFSISWSSAEYISLMWNQMIKLPSVGDPLKLRVLFLPNNAFNETTIDKLLVSSAKLTYLDLGSNMLTVIPECLCHLTELIHLDLSYNRIKEVPRGFGNLIKLKFLYLQYTSIKVIPEEVISRLEALEIIYVNLLWASDCIRSNVYRELGTLKHLKVVVTTVGLSDSWTSLNDAADLPVRSLNLHPSSERKEFHLYDILSLNFAQTTLYELEMDGDQCVTDITLIQRPEQQPYSFGILSNLIMRDLEALTTVKWIGTSPTSVFPRLTCLFVLGCIKLEHLSWAMYLPCLEELNVGYNYSMRMAFTRYHVDNVWCGHESSQTFPCLKKFHIWDCISLVTIADPDVTFPSLEELAITDCPQLKKLPFDMTSLPPSLKVLLMVDTEDWERLELEEGVKSFLQPKLQYY